MAVAKPKTIGDLKAAPYNPRTISEVSKRGLEASMSGFEDLSGIVWNAQSGNLVAGHQRLGILRGKGAKLKTRGALRRERQAYTSQIVAIALRLLHRHSPEIRMVVSFADPAQGHAGTIYQAMNWIYVGDSNPTQENFVDGRWRHVRRSYWRTKGRDEIRRRTRPGKHRYL